MQPNNLTALNYDDVKASIKTYLRTRDEFSDYDFEGSTLSYLIDILAYNTYYSAFTANMLINEAFIQSATTRGTIAQLAKLVNYVPQSITSAKTCVKLTLQTRQCNNEWPRFATLQEGAVLAGNGFVFHTLSDVTVPVDNFGVAIWDNLVLYEGSAVDYEYTVDTFERQRYLIPNEDADISTLRVSVRPNEQSTQVDTYNRVDIITELDNTSRIYYINESEDMRYEVFFGDGVIGRGLSDGEVVTLEYLVSNGEDANDIREFTFVGEVEDSCPEIYAGTEIVVEVKETSQSGAPRETVESIKYTAPRYYATQNRAVTTRDYETLVKKVYGNTDSAVAYGGDKLSPPVYGKVFIALKTKTGTALNNATKAEIAKNLQKYSMAAIETNIVDPDELFVTTKIFTTYDPNKTALVNSEIQAKIDDALAEYADQTGLNNFGGSYQNSALVRAVSLADPSIQAVSVQTTVLKYIKPVTNLTNEEVVEFGIPLFDSKPSQTVTDGDGNEIECKKEPVILGGPYYPGDDPGVPYFFEDDGSGGIYTFYKDGNTKKITNTKFGTINYDTGKVTIGPVAIVGDGGNVPTATGAAGSGTPGAGLGAGGDTVTGPDGTPWQSSDLQLNVPVMAIPANGYAISPTTPGTIVVFPQPPVTVSIIGTPLPPQIPLNSFDPGDYTTVPGGITGIPIIDGPSVTETGGCFS